jgi:hypothetical protein
MQCIGEVDGQDGFEVEGERVAEGLRGDGEGGGG